MPAQSPAPNTADPYGAQAHARAMAGTSVQSMPVVPATTRSDCLRASPPRPRCGRRRSPAAAMRRASSRAARGCGSSTVDGDACVSLLVFNAEHPVERLNVADTVKVQWNAYLGAGQAAAVRHGAGAAQHRRGRRRARTTPSAAHRTRPPTRAATATAPIRAPSQCARPASSSRVAKYGLGRRDIHPCVNLFKGVDDRVRRCDEPGRRPFHAGPGRDPARRDGPDRGPRELPARPRHRGPPTPSLRSGRRPGAAAYATRRPDPHGDARGSARLSQHRRPLSALTGSDDERPKRRPRPRRPHRSTTKSSPARAPWMRTIMKPGRRCGSSISKAIRPSIS